MEIGHEWSSMGVFLNSIWNAWGVFVIGGTLAALLLCIETMVLGRKAHSLGYMVILLLCVVSGSFVAWQEQYLRTRDYEKRLQFGDTERMTLTAQVGALSTLAAQRGEMLTAKTNAMASLEAQCQTTQRTLATEKEKHRSTYARAGLASLRAEGLRLSQKVLANPTEPTPDWEFWAWSQATERTLYTLFHREEVQDFNASRNAAHTSVKNYYDDYLSRSGGVLMEEGFKDLQSRLIALYISAQVSTLEKFSRNLNPGPLQNNTSTIYWQELMTQNR